MESVKVATTGSPPDGYNIFDEPDEALSRQFMQEALDVEPSVDAQITKLHEDLVDAEFPYLIPRGLKLADGTEVTDKELPEAHFWS